MKALISLDADVNSEDLLGRTPLDTAHLSSRLVYDSRDHSIQLSTISAGQGEEQEGESKTSKLFGF